MTRRPPPNCRPLDHQMLQGLRQPAAQVRPRRRAANELAVLSAVCQRNPKPICHWGSETPSTIATPAHTEDAPFYFADAVGVRSDYRVDPTWVCAAATSMP